MINTVILVGRLTATPTLSTTSNGISYTRFSIAVNRRNSNNETTDFINLVAWRNTAEFITKYATKGALVGIEGELHSNVYTSTATNSPVRTFDVLVNNFRLLESRQAAEMRNRGFESSFSNRSNQGFTPNSNHISPTDIDFSQVRTASTGSNPKPVKFNPEQIEENSIPTQNFSAVFDEEFDGISALDLDDDEKW
ncbi:single-stranded DNA-binding protein [Mycoplasmopsis gallopavonis]|uniref:Single-stranded DNA-binding protein n=1 Tax=Mycoplasmopsis gallopavonis TaxID=76629 RepID=A0A449AZW2_9BACT|nr:single-stranded DNA-binding protein [Mycoplasmopsis gallopavonis]RIV16429.1 single-stranded DNA-binding protein [Mycoplasmopsis gallopavonis]VEU73041.1 single strand binding protein [Mycoplasmopsis gallopavonis]